MRSLAGANQSHVPKNKINVQPGKTLLDLQEKVQVVGQIHALCHYNRQ